MKMEVTENKYGVKSMEGNPEELLNVLKLLTGKDKAAEPVVKQARKKPEELPTTREIFKPRKTRELSIREIYRQQRENESIAQIARNLGVSYSVIYGRLKKFKKIRSEGRKKWFKRLSPEEKNAVIERMNQARAKKREGAAT